MDKYLKDLLNFLNTATEDQLKEEEKYIEQFNYGPLAEEFVDEAFKVNHDAVDYSKFDYDFKCQHAPESIDGTTNFAKAA